ncbi:MAG: hypothetical protein ABR562_06785 [Thermoplasmatota archaeon]|nr:hypothetical protein [Halobacteriales archaeon]
MRPFRLVVLAVVTVVGLLLAAAAIAYFADYAVEAKVTEKQCRGSVLGGNSVTVQTKLFGVSYTLSGLPDHECQLVNSGNFVTYHLRSSRTSLYQSEGGPCIYDSENGVAGCA